MVRWVVSRITRTTGIASTSTFCMSLIEERKYSPSNILIAIFLAFIISPSVIRDIPPIKRCSVVRERPMDFPRSGVVVVVVEGTGGEGGVTCLPVLTSSVGTVPVELGLSAALVPSK